MAILSIYNENDNVLQMSNVDLCIDNYFIPSLGIYDPINWGTLDAKIIDIFIEK